MFPKMEAYINATKRNCFKKMLNQESKNSKKFNCSYTSHMRFRGQAEFCDKSKQMKNPIFKNRLFPSNPSNQAINQRMNKS